MFRANASWKVQRSWEFPIVISIMSSFFLYEDIYLKSYESVRELKAGLTRYFRFYNSRRFHQSLDYRTPEEMYVAFQEKERKAAA